MQASELDVSTLTDGSVIITPHGVIGPDGAVELRQTLVHTVRKVRPLRLVLDLADVCGVDPINVGTLSAACGLGDDHQVAIFLDNPTVDIAEQLLSAGVPPQRLRHIRLPLQEPFALTYTK